MELLAYIKPFEMQGRVASYISKGYLTENKWTIGTGHSYYRSYGHSVSMGVEGSSASASVYLGQHAGYAYMVMTWDATTKTLSGYVNGSDSKQMQTNASIVPTDIESPDPLYISGVYRTGGWAPINSDVAFARLWNRKLSDSEVDNLYTNWTATAQHSLPSGFDTTELLSEWLMYETSDASGNPGTTHIKDNVGENHLEMKNGAGLQTAAGALAIASPTNGATDVGPSVYLTASGGPGSLTDATGPMQYSFEIDEVSTFDSAALRQSGWFVHYSEWQPALKPDTTYYWHVKVRNSSPAPETSDWTPTASFTTRAARSWYVRNLSPAGTYGSEDGSSYTNAFNGLNNRIDQSVANYSDGRGVVWGPGGVESGDTLYICGEHTVRHSSSLGHAESGQVYVPINGHSEAYPVTIRADCPEEPGIVYGFSKRPAAPYTWHGPDSNGVYCTSNNLATPLYADLGGPGPQFMLRESATTWTGHLGYWFENDGNTYVKMPDGGDPAGRISEHNYGWQLLAEHRQYITFRNCDFRGYHFEDDRGTSGPLPRSTFITWDHCTLQYGGKLVQLGRDNDHWSIRHCTLKNAGSAIYSMNNRENFAGDHATIEHNIITDLGVYENGYSDGDNHAVGAQGSSHWLVQHNHIENTGSAIEFWNGLGEGRTMQHNIIRYNFIKDANAMSTTEGNGIGVSGSNGDSLGQRTGFVIYGNIIIDTEGHGITSNNPDPVMLYHNTIVGHGNREGGDNDGHGIREGIASSYPAAMTVKNTMIVNTANRSTSDINKQYFYHIYSGFDSSIEQVHVEYNNYYPDANVGYEFSVSGASHKSLSEIQAQTGLDLHSIDGDPLLASGSPGAPEDVCLAADSPSIDAGIDVGLTEDFNGNPIYGRPDIGAMEYQPPYVMGSNAMDIAANVRVYADGRFRNTAAPTGTSASLVIQPEGVWPTNDYREWMNVAIGSWSATLMSWTEASAIASNTAHTVGGLVENCFYDLSVNGSPGAGITGAGWTNGRCMASSAGVVAFICTNGYSTNLFELVKSDADRLPDAWEMQHFGDISEVDTGDRDEDGLGNLQEWIAGTDPADRNSRLEIRNVRSEGNAAVLEFQSVSGRLYAVEYKDDLRGTNEWVDLTNGWPGTDGVFEYGDTRNVPRSFYRIRVTRP